MSGDTIDLEAEAAALDGYFSDTPLEPKPKYPPLRESFENAILVTNIPKIGKAKLAKLTNVITKLLSKIAPLAADADADFTGLHIPYSADNDTTYGFCFAAYDNEEDAKKAVIAFDGYSFDKRHILGVMPYSKLSSLLTMDETEFTEPKPSPFVEKPSTVEWLEDPNQRDCYVVRHGRETCVYWSDGKNDPIVDYDGSREKQAGVAWCEYYCHWSPKGSYLATLVPSKGVILWSGSKYEKTGRFRAEGVEYILFSPNENYLLTSNNRRNDPNAVQIFNIQTGQCLRTFELYPKNFKHDNGNVPPPPFLWSHDDKYIARMQTDLISIWEAPSMTLLEKKSLSAEGVLEFQWSPKANILSYWVRSRESLLYICNTFLTASLQCRLRKLRTLLPTLI